MAEGGSGPGEVRAAGAIVWRPGPAGGAAGAAGVEAVLVHRPRYDDWTFPKGKCAPAEHILLTAVREVAEETGIRVELGRRLPASRYEVRGRRKRVDWWVARAAGGPGSPQPEFEPGAETDRLAWLELAAARQRLTYPRDVPLLDEFAAGPADTVPLILLRHARAENKQAWRDAGHTDDQPRPLDPHGAAQAGALAGLLGCYPAAEVFSSPAQRCVSTVQPYAALAGTPLRLEPAFAVTAGAPARQRIEQIVAAARPAVVCAHRENLPMLLDWACSQLGGEPPDGPPLGHGAFWVLHASFGKLASAEQHALPVLPGA